MLRALLPLGVVILSIYTFIDAVTTDERDVRGLPKVAWAVMILLLPVLGPMSWLLAGRPRSGQQPADVTARPPGTLGRAAPPRPAAPSEDADFLRQMKASNDEHERMLKQWEDDLRHREEQLRKKRRDDRPGGDAQPPPGPPQPRS